MKYCIGILFLLFAVSVAAQQKGPGNCTGFTRKGNTVFFSTDNKSAVAIKLVSKDLFRVWYSPDGRFKRNNESFAVLTDSLEDVGVIQVHEQQQAYEIFTDRLRIRINRFPFQLQVFDKYQRLIMSDWKEMGLGIDSNRIYSYKQLRPDEQFIGLGEKSGPVNKRGRTWTMWNSDKPCYSTEEDPLYKSIPFFMSSYQYGIFFDNTYKTVFKFGSESSQYYSFEAPAGEMIYYFMYGKDYKELLQQYVQLTGLPIMPPKWAFGFSQSRGLLTNEKLTREIAKGYRDRNIPCDIIYQDIGWVDALQSFDWHPEKYQQPEQLLGDLEKQGFKVVVSQDPVISQANKMQWETADSLGYLVKDSRNGKSYDMPWPWGGNCGVVDFTNPAVANWWGALQQKPVSIGVKGFWTDMGEPAWSNEDAEDRLFMQHQAGMHNEIHNVYGLTWDKVVKEQFEKHNPNQRIFQMTRAAYAGLQRYTFGWSGDSGNGNDVLDGWSNLAGQLPLALSAGMGGIPFWATDISGYCGDIKDYAAMAELYVRWLQFGIFNPLSRAHHEGNNAVEPWLFGAEAERISKAAIELKYRLFPYIYTCAREAHETGLPIMRAMVLEYPGDNTCYALDDQFMFGPALLVAPVVKKNSQVRRIYLPEGQWYDFHQPELIYEGQQWIDYAAPLEKIPILVKRGSIIPMMPVMQYIHEKQDYPLTLQVFPGPEKTSSEFLMYEDDGVTLRYLQQQYSTTAISCRQESGKVVLTISAPEHRGYIPPGKRNYEVMIRLNNKPGKLLVDQKKHRYSWNSDTKMCTISLAVTSQEQVVEIHSK